MPQLLKLAHLVKQHRMPQMEVGRCRIETGLDLERDRSLDRLFELFLEFLFQKDIHCPAFNYFHLFCNCHFHIPLDLCTPATPRQSQQMLIRSIPSALPLSSSISTTTPFRRMLLFATSNFTGIWVRNF